MELEGNFISIIKKIYAYFLYILKSSSTYINFNIFRTQANVSLHFIFPKHFRIIFLQAVSVSKFFLLMKTPATLGRALALMTSFKLDCLLKQKFPVPK